MTRNDTPSLVRALRTRLGLTQEKFASKLGVSFPTVSRWENGKNVPSSLALRQLEGLVKHLKKDGADLMEKYFGGRAKRG